MAGAEDIPLPNFAVEDGSPLQLPIGVNPLAYFSMGSPTHTVYIGDTAHGCPKAPGANGSSSQSYCTYASSNPGGGAADDLTAVNAVTGAWDGTYWDVWVTHGSHFDSSTPWVWPYVAATGWLVFHSDCTQTSPCVGTNDLGYNPRGRQVCSHGPMDQLTNPPLPNMGWRNHGCTGATLGFPSTASPIPVTSAAYVLTNKSSYDDLANMWTVSSSSNGVVTGSYCSGIPSTYCTSSGGPSLGSVIQMSMGPHDSSTNCYGGYCPTDGVNHIGIQDAAVVADPAGNNIIPVQIQAPEWAVNPNPSPLIRAFVNAAPHDIFFDEDYFSSDADDDGFGVNLIATEIGVGCVRCSFNHNYFDGIKRDGSEGHVISIEPPGPTQIVDNWVEGNSIGLWGGGGGTPPVCADASNPCDNGLLTQNTERARNRLTYNPRWLPSPGGIQAVSPTVTSWTCATGALVMTLKTTASLGETTGGIYSPIIYVNLPGSGVTPQWYNASAFSPACASSCAATVPSITSCTASSTATGNIAGFAYATQNATPITVTSAMALNADSCGSSTWSSLQSPCNPIQHMNPVAKNRSETKESQAVWMDAELLENSGLDGQEGQLWSMSVRACSGVSKCSNGQTQDINDYAITNSIARHATQGMMRDARSGAGSYGCWGDSTGPCSAATQTLMSVACDSPYNNVIDFTFSANPTILNAQGAVLPNLYTPGNGYPGASTFAGTDVYVYNVGSDLASLLPNGWYQTENIQYGATIPVFLPAGETCTPGHTYTAQGTILGINNGNGAGVSPGMHHAVTQNNLLYDLGNHLNWNGSGTSIPSFTASSGGNNYSVNVIMGPATGTHCTSSGMAPGTIGAVACAYITAIRVCAAAPFPRSGIPDCPLLLQAEAGDLMNVQCPSNAAFSTGAPVTAANGGGAPNQPGAKVIDLDSSGQQWFTYIPQPVSGGLPSAGTTATCPVEPPNGSWTTLTTDQGSSGLYNNNSYPKTQQFNHNTAVAMNGGRVYGASFETNLTWENTIIAVPGTGDTGLPGVGTQSCGSGMSCGFTSPGSDAYTGTPAPPCMGATGSSQNSTGITNMGDPTTLTFLGMAVAGTTVTNYPIWQNNTPNCTGATYAANGNSAPAQTSTPGGTVTCSGAPCSIANYSPDSIGFAGATNTNTYPLNLTDWRLYAVSCSYWTSQGLACPTAGGIDPNSPYKAGNIFQASDGLDNGIIPAYIANAFARTLRPCLLVSGCPTYYHDGPQYEWLTWKCSGACSNFNVYEDGMLVLTTASLYAQVYGLAVNSSHTWAVTSTSGSVSGLTSQMY